MRSQASDLPTPGYPSIEDAPVPDTPPVEPPPGDGPGCDPVPVLPLDPM